MPTNPLTPLLGEGCCASCGFLCHSVGSATAMANHGRFQTVSSSEILSVDIYMRASGSNFGGMFPDPAKLYWSWAAPLCFIFAATPSLAEETGFDPADTEPLDRLKVAGAIQRGDRHCAKWFEWRPGIGPAEHVRMRDMIELENDRRTWEKKLEDDRKEREDVLEVDRRKFERSLTASQIRAAAGAAAVSIFVAVALTYLTIRATQPKDGPNPQPVLVVTAVPSPMATEVPSRP